MQRTHFFNLSRIVISSQGNELYHALRMSRIKDKKKWSDLIMDGHIPNIDNITHKELMNMAMEKLELLFESELYISNSEDLFCEIEFDTTNIYYTELSDFSKINKIWNTSKSETIFNKIKEDNNYWLNYHQEYSKSRESWFEIPYQEIGKILLSKYLMRPQLNSCIF